jgi:GT2 family glycosyltransferase
VQREQREGFVATVTTGQTLTRVVLVSYQTGPVLFEAVRAVLAQTAPIELVVVDNGNPPEVVDSLRQCAEVEPRLTFLTGHGNVGFSRGCNLGAAAETGPASPAWDHVLFLNPDGVIARDVVARVVDAWSRLSSRAMLGVRLTNADGSEQRGCRRNLLTPRTAVGEMLRLDRLVPAWPRLNLNDEPLPHEIGEVPAISGAFMFLHRADLARIGGFDPDYFLHAEDLDLCLRFRRAGGRIYFVPDVEVLHHGGTSEVASGFVEGCKAESFALYFRKHFPRHGWWAAPLMRIAVTARMMGRAAQQILVALAASLSQRA